MAEKHSFTPGPWRRGAKADLWIYSEQRLIAKVCPDSTSSGANARLIATATEMARHLEAARHLLKSYEYGNSATEPAKDMAERIEAVLKEAGIEVTF